MRAWRAVAGPLGLGMALAMAASGPARAGSLTAIVAGRSAITFVVREMNVPVEGRFARFTVQLDFDPASPAGAKATIDIDAASIDAGNAEANDEVVGRDWLDVRQFPQARFEATSFRALGGNRYEVNGKLAIKGHTREVTAPFTLVPQAGGAVIDGAFTLQRADFALGERSWSDFDTVANEIQVRFHFTAAGK